MFNGTYSVLLIEDDSVDAKHLKRRLNSHRGTKVAVTHVETLEAAIEVLKSESFDVLLIDMNLPDSQGLDTVRRMINAAPQAAAIVLSGLANDETAMEAVREGAQDYIVKSNIDHVDVLKSIEFAIERQHVADELRKARDREKMHAQFKSDFLAQMSHEIRTPMNGVIGMTSLLLASPHLSAEDRARVETIRSSGESLLSILNDVLDISKIEAGKYSLQSSEFNVRSLIEDCLETFAQTSLVHHITLTNLVFPEVPRMIRADVQRLRQILTNLISNALKFTHEGYVCVSASIDANDPRKLRFEVKDTGDGIDVEKQSKLFAPFVQAELTHQFSGTGLGLTICKNLVELMGGRIGVQSAEGQGSTFWFTIDFTSVSSQTHRDRPSFAQSRVVILGQDEGTNHLLKSQLQLRGFNHIRCATSCEQSAPDDELSPDLLIINSKGLTASQIKHWTTVATSSGSKGAGAVLLLAFDETNQVPRDHLIRFPLRQSILYRRAALILSGDQDEEPAHDVNLKTARSEKSLGPLDVLVVDDGAVNRKVASQMLTILQHRVDTAESGNMALNMLEVKKYDLIFMDCRMPGLSGLETTRLLRESRSWNADTPVVALTANAFPEDREQCEAAGMNEFLVKPVVLEDMVRVIERCSQGFRAKAEAPTKGESENLSALDIATLTMLKSLEPADGSCTFLDDLIETFTQDTPDVIAQVVKALQQGETEAVQHYAHKLKGYARNLGAQQLADLAGNVEDHADSPWDISLVSSNLQKAYSQATAALSHWHSRHLNKIPN